MGHMRCDRFRRLLVISATRRTTVGAAIASLLLARVGGIDAVAASKRGKRRRRKARKRERERERLCQQVCGGSCQTCRDLCASCDDVHPCIHLTGAAQPICKLGLISACQPCTADADCGGLEFCVTGITFDGTTEQIAQCGAYSVGVCMEELP